MRRSQLGQGSSNAFVRKTAICQRVSETGAPLEFRFDPSTISIQVNPANNHLEVEKHVERAGVTHEVGCRNLAAALVEVLDLFRMPEDNSFMRAVVYSTAGEVNPGWSDPLGDDADCAPPFQEFRGGNAMISVKCLPGRRTAAELCPLIFLLSNFWLFPAPAGPQAAAAAQADFPLTLKTRWTYHLHQTMGPGVHFEGEMAKLARGDSLDVTEITEVAGSDLINGENYVRLESRLNGAPYGTEWYRQTTSGLLLGKRFSVEDGQEIPMDPPQKLLSSTLKAGESWDWNGELGAPVVMHIRVVGPTDLKVPAGTFHTTRLNYDFAVEAEGKVITVRQARWFVPGVGFVKNDVETLMGGHLLTRIVLTLEKYEPAPGGKSVGGR